MNKISGDKYEKSILSTQCGLWAGRSGLLILRIAPKPYETRMAIHKCLRLGYNKPIGSQSEMK